MAAPDSTPLRPNGAKPPWPNLSKAITLDKKREQHDVSSHSLTHNSESSISSPVGGTHVSSSLALVWLRKFL